jgi:hypothetical protein
MRAIWFGAAAAALALSAPTSIGAQAVPNVPTVRARDGDHLLRTSERILLDTIAIWHDLPAAAATVFSSTRQILDSLKIPYTRTDSAGGLISNEALVTRGGRLAGRANSKSLRCGFGPSGDYADNWRVQVAYAIYVHPVIGGGTRLGIALTGQAKDMSGASSPRVICASTGGLESEIARLVRNRLSG